MEIEAFVKHDAPNVPERGGNDTDPGRTLSGQQDNLPVASLDDILD
jgi:hypothetical protein